MAFFSNRDGSFAGYVVDAGGGEPKRITPQEAPNVGDLRWSPDGTTIAFSTSSGVDSDVWLVGADGSSPRKVSTQAGSNQPAWSPDGTSLAIAAQPVGEPDPGIYQLDPKTGATKLLADTKYRDSFPVWSWSPEGKFLYFVSAVPNDDADGGDADDLYRVASRGGKPEGVITDPISIESELQPTADGRLIVFSVARLRDKEVFVANADGSGAIPVSRSDRKDSFGAWRPGTGPDQR